MPIRCLLRTVCLLQFPLLLLTGCGASDTARPLIFDTDWWTDVDDACAVRILLNADRSGVADVLGVCLSAVDGESYESIGKFLAYEGYPDLPVGADKAGTDFLGTPSYRAPILLSVDTKPLTDSEVEPSVSFYRRLLAHSRRRVDIVAVGFPNTLALLLQSPADEWSSLTGEELVREKVGTLYLMAGNYPEGQEHNFCLTPRSREAGAVVCAQWPGEIIFLGFEVGVEVVAGGSLPHDDLLYRVMDAHGSAAGRYMWDPLTLVIALQGSPAAAGFGEVRGTNSVDPATGANHFTPDPAGKHRYVTLQHEASWYAERLDKVLGSRGYTWPVE